MGFLGTLWGALGALSRPLVVRAKDQGQGLRIRVPLGGPGWEEGPERPEARGQRPEVRGQRPEARGQRPEARDQRPDARGQRPGGQEVKTHGFIHLKPCVL